MKKRGKNKILLDFCFDERVRIFFGDEYKTGNIKGCSSRFVFLHLIDEQRTVRIALSHIKLVIDW